MTGVEPIREPEPVRCLCSHPEHTHGTDRKGRLVCWSAACGCASFRRAEK